MRKRLVIAMGYVDDSWHSSRIFAESIAQEFQSKGGDVTYFAPRLGHRPRWYHRRLFYGPQIPEGDYLHLVDQSYGDAILRVRQRFEKIITTVHDTAFLTNTRWYNRSWRRRIRSGLASADYLVPISSQTASELEGHFASEKVGNIISPGADTRRFSHQSAQRNPRELLYIGSAIRRKGLDRLIYFLASLAQDYRLTMLGTKLQPAQEQLIETCDLGDRVTTNPQASDSDIDSALAKSSALVVPSRYEGFGVPVIEARLRGTRVIGHCHIPAIKLLKNRDDIGTTALDFDQFNEGPNPSATNTLGNILKPDSLELKDRQLYSWTRVAEEYGHLLFGASQIKCAG